MTWDESEIPDICDDPECLDCQRSRDEERARRHGSFGCEWFDKKTGAPIWENVT